MIETPERWQSIRSEVRRTFGGQATEGFGSEAGLHHVPGENSGPGKRLAGPRGEAAATKKPPKPEL